MGFESIEQDAAGVADRLDDLIERLAELGIDALRLALEDPDGDGVRPEIEKRLSKARRSMERAAHPLRGEPSSTLI